MTQPSGVPTLPTTSSETWHTKITCTAAGVITPRGFAIEQLMGTLTFTAVVRNMLRGELLDARTRSRCDPGASIVHSTTSQSAMTARTVASSGTPGSVAATGGPLAIDTPRWCPRTVHDGLVECRSRRIERRGHAACGPGDRTRSTRARSGLADSRVRPSPGTREQSHAEHGARTVRQPGGLCGTSAKPSLRRRATPCVTN